MWKPLQKSPIFLLKLEKEKDFYEVGVTNYKRTWTTVISRFSLLEDLKKSNEGLECDDENELIEKGLDILHNPQSLKDVNILEDKGQLAISMKKVYDFSLKLELSLVEASCENFFQAVVQPLLKTVCDLRSSQLELRELLKKKDKEIDRFRSEGQVPRRDKTHVYDDAGHIAKHTAYEKYFSAPEMPVLLQAVADAEVKKPRLNPVTAAQMTTQNLQATTSEYTRIKHKPTENNVHEQVPKIEKCSQNSPMGDIPPFVPAKVKEENTIGHGMDIKPTVEVKKKLKQKPKITYLGSDRNPD